MKAIYLRLLAFFLVLIVIILCYQSFIDQLLPDTANLSVNLITEILGVITSVILIGIIIIFHEKKQKKPLTKRLNNKLDFYARIWVFELFGTLKKNAPEAVDWSEVENEKISEKLIKFISKNINTILDHFHSDISLQQLKACFISLQKSIEHILNRYANFLTPSTFDLLDDIIESLTYLQINLDAIMAKPAEDQNFSNKSKDNIKQFILKLQKLNDSCKNKDLIK